MPPDGLRTLLCKRSVLVIAAAGLLLGCSDGSTSLADASRADRSGSVLDIGPSLDIRPEADSPSATDGPLLPDAARADTTLTDRGPLDLGPDAPPDAALDAPTADSSPPDAAPPDIQPPDITCTNECTLGATSCVGASDFKTCLMAAWGCTQWSPVQSCGAGRPCLQSTGQCCTPVCTGKECGPDGCGGNCGPCTYGCTQGRCRRKLTVVSIFLDCDKCGDPLTITPKPDPYLELELKNGVLYQGSTLSETCNTFSYPWTSPSIDPAQLEPATFRIMDSDVGGDDLCQTWSGNYSALGTHTLTGAMNTKLTYTVIK